MDQLIGCELNNRYQITSLLGRQPGRRTYLARDLDDFATPVVIKLLIFDPDFKWDSFKLFEREIAVLKCLDHPKIPTYLNYFETETQLGKGIALVQSYIDARSLQDLVQSGYVFDRKAVKAIAQSLLEVLDYLHSQNPPVVHRDIKPSNILLGDPPAEKLRSRTKQKLGNVYLVDFGSVQTLASVEGQTFTVVGTYGYMPFEQFSGRSVPASDLYGLGATLLYLLSGKHPADFPQQDMRIQFEAHTHVDLSFARWLGRLLEPNLDQRFSSAQSALQDLNQLRKSDIPTHHMSDDSALNADVPTRCKRYLTEKNATTLHWTVTTQQKLSDFGHHPFKIYRFWVKCLRNSPAKPLISQAWINVLFYAPMAALLYALAFMMIIMSCGALAMALYVTISKVMDVMSTWIIVGMMICFWLIVFCNVGYSRLRKFVESELATEHFVIRNRQISVTYQFLGICWKAVQCPETEIQKLAYTPQSDRKPPAIEIWINYQRYRIAWSDRLNELELNWLTGELSELLNRGCQTANVTER